MEMDGLSRIEPLLDAVRPERRERTGSLEDPVLESFLDHIDRYLEKLREQRKVQEEARLEDRRLQVEYDRKLSFLKGKVDEALHAMLAVRENAEPGVTTPEERRYQYWKTELEHFKQRGRIAGV
jgi:hypothetical protein